MFVSVSKTIEMTLSSEQSRPCVPYGPMDVKVLHDVDSPRSGSPYHGIVPYSSSILMRKPYTLEVAVFNGRVESAMQPSPASIKYVSDTIEVPSRAGDRQKITHVTNTIGIVSGDQTAQVTVGRSHLQRGPHHIDVNIGCAFVTLPQVSIAMPVVAMHCFGASIICLCLNP